MRPASAQALSFILHLEVFNSHRWERMIAVARTLMAGGHQVLITYEDQIAVRFAPDDPQIQYWDARARGQKVATAHPDLRFEAISPFCGRTPPDLESAQRARADMVADLIMREDPSFFMIWGGNFEFQTGTLDGIDRARARDRAIFCEVAWLPQQSYMYFDRQGVNSKSSLVNFSAPPLSPGQQRLLDQFRQTFINQRTGGMHSAIQDRSVFVPLQIESDSSFRLGSPFGSNAEFVAFLEDWLPPDWSATLKLHPKERVRCAPLGTARGNFRVLKAGALDAMMLPASHVIGINSTTLLEAATLGKPAVAFGHGLHSGSGALVEARPDQDAEEVLAVRADEAARDAFLYELLFCRQVSLAALKRADYEHLASRAPFDEILCASPAGGTQPHLGKIKQGEAMIRVGKSRVAKSALLDVEKGGEIVIGDDSEIRHNAVIEVSGRYNGMVQIGDHSVIGVGSWLQGSGRIEIGDDVIIGPYASIVSTNHQYADASIPVARQPLTTGSITIEDDVWLGAHVTVASDVRIGAHSIIGANSFVNADIPPYSVAVGSPARVIKTRKP